jgi:hypothetical protein
MSQPMKATPANWVRDDQGEAMNDVGATAGESDAALAEQELFRRLTEMLSPQHDPPAVVTELAKQSFGLRTVDAELAALVADSEVEGTAAAVRRGHQVPIPRLLTFRTPGLLVELEVGRSGSHHRILGELVPEGRATVEVRQPRANGPRSVEADDEGRFVIESLQPGPFSLTCRRTGRSPVATEWTCLD